MTESLAHLSHLARVGRLLWSVDAASVRRDSLLRWVLVLPLALALLLRWGLPLVVEQIEPVLGLEMQPYVVPLMGAALLTMCPTIAGMVVGFLLLDQRDDRSLTALQVTPLPLPAYLTYRLLAPVAISIVLTMAAQPLAGYVPLQPGTVLPLLAGALAAAPLAPLFALALSAFAENKVQGFVLVKASGLVTAAPLIAYFVPAPWQWAFGIVPTFWTAKVYWLALAGDPTYLLCLVAGTLYSALLTMLLLRRLTDSLHR